MEIGVVAAITAPFVGNVKEIAGAVGTGGGVEPPPSVVTSTVLASPYPVPASGSHGCTRYV